MVRILFLWGTAIVLGISGLWSEGATAYAQEGATTDEARAIDGAEENGVALEGEEELSLEERVALLESLLRESKAGDPKTMRFFWDGGPRAETADGNFKFRLTGRLHNDWAFLSADDEIEQAFGDFQDGVEFRRARVGVQGLLFQHFEFKIQFDFAQGDTDFRDVYGALVNVFGVDRIQVGQFKEPFGLEELTSSNDISFMERGLVNPFTPAYQTGVMVQDSFKTPVPITAALGVFRPVDAFGDGLGEGNYNVTGRLTAAPLYEDDGRRLVHVGAAASYRNPDVLRFSERPENHLALRLVDTMPFPITDEIRTGLETAVVFDSFSAQAEFISSFVDGRGAAGDPTFYGFYVMGGYVLTGEHRPYDPKKGVFKSVVPDHPFLTEGCGAWEILARYSQIDLDSDGIDGGTLHDFTAGLNWYWNEYFRVMFNYVLAMPEGFDEVHIGALRFQFDF